MNLFEGIIRQSVIEEAKIIRKSLKNYTSKWTRENQPYWSFRIKRTPRDYSVFVGTRDKPFIYVEKGTRRRYRKMSWDFRAKTKPGTMKTSSGAGKATGFYKTPRAGIKARDNLETLAKERRKIFSVKLARKINASATLLYN